MIFEVLKLVILLDYVIFLLGSLLALGALGTYIINPIENVSEKVRSRLKHRIII